jgi:arsenate reductase-like glutaredoxin family protein
LGEQPASNAFNFSSQAFKKSGLDKETLMDDDLVRLIAKEPRYLKRPFITVNGRTILVSRQRNLLRNYTDVIFAKI